MASILILVQVFPPYNVATAQLYGDLAKDLVALGDQVTVLTTTPYYSFDPNAKGWMPQGAKGLRWGFPCGTMEHNGIRVCRTWMPRKRPNALYRLGCWGWFHAVSTFAGLFVKPRPDVILCPSPPPTIALSAYLLGKRYGVPFVYNAQELYPDVAINLGLVRNRFLIRRLLALEKFIYANAAAITVISSRMRLRILEKGVPEQKAVLLPNFADTETFRPLPRDNRFSREHGLLDKFVVSYAGNMGKPQHLDVLLRAAARLKSETQINFLLIGDGAERAALVELAEKMSLANVSFLPYQSYSLMDQVYAASDLSYVPQAAGTSSDGVPSKVYRIMASGRPVLAATDSGSDLAAMVLDSGGGEVAGATNEQEVAETILRAFCNRSEWSNRGERARRYILENFSRSRITGLYHELLNRVAAGSSKPCQA
jgi:colanic acid biosynthesis glycosyl transferase WcaI